MTAVSWSRVDLTIDLFKCTLCGEQADTIHFLNINPAIDMYVEHVVRDGGQPGLDPRPSPIEVVFSCPEHVAHGNGDYSPDLEQWLDPGERFDEHVGQKAWGPYALEVWWRIATKMLRTAADGDQR